MHILVIDAQGGGVGRQLITQIKAALPDADILAVGTNSSAAAAMLKAGADTVATGENSVVVGARRADIIIGPVGIVIADAMNGEITPKMAAAVGSSDARRILIPFNTCYTYIAGVEKNGMAALIADAIRELKETVGK